MFAQDLHPWPVAGLQNALTPVAVDELEAAGARLLDKLKPLRATLYATTCPRHGASELLGAFWVRVRSCPGCETTVHLFPYAMISRASRRADEQYSWWGCSACGHVTLSKDDTRGRRCGQCGRPLAPADRPLLEGRMVRCPTAGCGHEFAAFDGAAPAWRCVLVQRACPGDTVHLDRPTATELRAAVACGPRSVPEPLNEEIPPGLETRALKRAGLVRWSDLYTTRQLRVLAEAHQVIAKLRVTAAIRDRLKLALAGCAEMAGHVSRWDRYYPKAFEAAANHRFAVTGLSYETNLLARRGRGSLPHRLRHSLHAARWIHEQLPRDTAVRSLSSAS